MATPVGYARQDCEYCKAHNRPCSKALPTCSLCYTKSLVCNYGPSSGSLHVASQGAGTVQQAGGPFNPVMAQMAPPTHSLYFLDGELSAKWRVGLPTPEEPSDYAKLDLRRDINARRGFAEEYFKTVHTFMPIIVKPHFMLEVLSTAKNGYGKPSLLMICVRLAIKRPASGRIMSKIPEYLAAKEWFTKVVEDGACDIRTLQAGVLIALYEFGHGIYPAAYFTIGMCARYGTAYNYDALEGSTNLSWIMSEEKRRTWWAILILDRCANLGNPKRALITQDPGPNSFLPVNDDEWDKQQPASDEILTLFSPTNLLIGKYTRFAQAGYLLGQVSKHVSNYAGIRAISKPEAEQIQRTLQGLVALIDFEGENNKIETFMRSSLCYAGILILRKSLDPSLNDLLLEVKGRFNLGVPQSFIEESIATEAAKIARIFPMSPRSTEATVSPFIMHLLYQANVFYMSKTVGSSAASASQAVGAIEQLLTLLSKRWQVAGTYLNIIRSRKATPGA